MKRRLWHRKEREILNIDYILTGGYVIYGDRPDDVPVKADVAVAGDMIRAVGDLSDVQAERIIDITGLYLCPGFIDAHAHSDFVLLADGRAEAKICQGITTEINGNCGLSAAPLYGAALEQRERDIAEFDIRERWNSFSEYFALLEKRKIAVNTVTLTGHGNLRASIAGYEKRTLSLSEMERALQLLRESIASGSKGLSTGLIYPPGVFADTAEIITLAKEVAVHNGIYTTHMRSEGDHLLESIDEVVRIAKDADVRVHISHLKTSDEKNWTKIDEVFNKIEGARSNGLSVTCDRYPYIASSTDLDAVLPSWAFEGGHKHELKRLRQEPKRLERAIMKEHPDPSIWEEIFISSVITQKNKWMEGMNIFAISRSLGKSEMSCLFDLLIEEDLSVGAVFFIMNEENLEAILGKPYTMIGSDSTARCFDGITAKGVPHPRGFGSFPRVLGKYVREEKVLPVGEAVYKMTGLPAATFRLDRRGHIAEGYYADITVFDPENINDTADFVNPFQRPEGIHYVFVNGVPVVEEGVVTGAMPGRVLK